MSEIEVKKDWMDYANLAANIHQSIKLGEISNQLSQLTDINTAMLGNMNNLVNIEVYKLEQEENEKQFKQLLFNLKKFVKTIYEDPLTVALLKNGHCKMIDSLLDNFQRELTSFEDKEYVENIMDSFNEYSSADVDYKTLGETNEDDITLLLSYMMFTDQISAKAEKLVENVSEIDSVRAKYYTPMQKWTAESLNDWFRKIDCYDPVGEPRRMDDDQSGMLNEYVSNGEIFQFIFKPYKENKTKVKWFRKKSQENDKVKGLGLWGPTFKEYIAELEKEVIEKTTDSQSNKVALSSEIETSLSSLSEDLVKSNSEWINVEKKLLNIMHDTTLPIQGPYQYRKQVIGD
jgi:hypothetical protein